MSNYPRPGADRFGGNSSRKPAFNKKPWGQKRSGDGPATLYKATCAKCGNTCEVPFRPNGQKPVYCSNCFERRPADHGGDRFPRQEFNAPRPSFDGRGDTQAVAKQLESLNAKLERLIRAVESFAPKQGGMQSASLAEVIEVAVPKKSAPKKAKKK